VFAVSDPPQQSLLAALVHHGRMTNAGLDPVSLLAHAESLAETSAVRPETFKAVIAALKTEIAEAAATGPLPAPPSIRPALRSTYNIVGDAHSLFHHELACYATDNDRVVGIVVEDKHDHDFGWVALMRDPAGEYRAIDLKVSLDRRSDRRDRPVCRSRRLPTRNDGG
jgi:hypothetical protein